jgi:hypothetical protein
MRCHSLADGPDFMTLSAELADNWQFRGWILGEGYRIEVIELHELRMQIAESISHAYKLYFAAQGQDRSR